MHIFGRILTSVQGHGAEIDRRRLITLFAGGAIAAAGARAPALAATNTGFSSRRLTVTRFGQRGKNGRDIILIPGLASDPGIWAGLRGHLPGHRLHMVHIAGFSNLAAGANADGPLLRPVADELARYIGESGLRAPAIIGHSMGGMLGMMLGLRQNAVAGRIMVVDMLPDGAAMVGGTSAGLGYLAGQINGYLTGTKAGRQILADMVARTPGGRDSDPRVIAQALAEMAQTDLTPRLPALSCPLEVIYAVPADQDTARRQAQRYRIAYARARQARLMSIGPSGHMVMLDQPATFLQAVDRFLN